MYIKFQTENDQRFAQLFVVHVGKSLAVLPQQPDGSFVARVDKGTVADLEKARQHGLDVEEYYEE